MRAFLSHSSKDKAFITTVADALRPGSFELDSVTFDSGLLNSQAILAALKRCDLFCLFLSSNAIASRYVDFETLFGTEFHASGSISRFLSICVDPEAFAQASEGVKHFNVIRQVSSPEQAARLIQGQLILASKHYSMRVNPFIGRDNDIAVLGDQINDYERPPSKALYVSGNFGSGRRTVSRHFYKNYFPHVATIFPTIQIDQFAGLEELYRAVMVSLRPSMPARQLLSDLGGFRMASTEEKMRLTAEKINSLLGNHEAAFILDQGGVLTDAGSFAPEIDGVLMHLRSRPHPPIVFISPRMIPRRFRREDNDVSYLSLSSLRRRDVEALISALARSYDISLTGETLEKLVDLSDSHPFNIYRMIEDISDSGIDTFLANPSNFIDWKHRQSSEYLGKITLEELEVKVLAVLKIVPELDFMAIVESLTVEPEDASLVISRLIDLHILESTGDRFVVSPPLRVAVERDQRIKLSSADEQVAIRTLSDSLSMRLEGGTAQINLIGAAVLASLQSGAALSSIAAAFLLPSHYVWMAKRNYDDRRWSECVRYSRLALEGRARLSGSGVVGACRFLCLASARTGDQDTFEEGMRILQSGAADAWAKSNVAFLQGFNLRLWGRLPEAEESFRRAYELSPGNFSAGREIASACLERGNLEEAERFAREAHQHARRNPFVVDILVGVLIRRAQSNQGGGRMELEEMFTLLKEVGEEDGRSFYTTRRAEYEHLRGNNQVALELIEEAIAKTPSLFEPRRLHAEILLDLGNKSKAQETIGVMEEMVNSNRRAERRKNYRQYLETHARYLVETDRYANAKIVYEDRRVFSEEERREAVRKIEIVQGHRGKK